MLKKNLADFRPSLAVIDNGGNLEREDDETEEGDKKICGLCVEILFIDIMKKPQRKLLRRGFWNLPDPIEIHRRDETVSNEFKQCLWTYYQWFMEWTGTTRIQILRTRLPDGYKWVDGRPSKIRKIARPDSTWYEPWTQSSKKQK